MEDTVLIIGDSPFLKEVEGVLAYAVNRYPSLGMNVIVKKYKTSVHIFQDSLFIPLTNSLKDIKTVTLQQYGDLIRKENKELHDSFSFNFKEDTSQDIIKGDKLAWGGFTHDYAISYSIYKGFKNIILVGAADFVQGPHYVHGDTFKYSNTLKDYSKRFIEEYCMKRANIYTCNPASYLNIPRIDINTLLK